MTIAVDTASKSYGDFRALDEVSVEVPNGSMTALLGPSGSGKSTLLRAIAGLERLDSGRVLIGGVDQTGRPVRSRNVGFVFQHYAAFKHMSVFENVAFGPRVRGWPKPRIRSRVGELLELVQLNGLAERYPSQLSGGQRQRMALARALAVDPEVMLLDEPFGALDAKVRKDLRTWLRRLHREVHVTTIFVTHDQEEAMDVAGQIVVMNEGRVEQAGTATDLYDSPANAFVMGFVGEVNRIDGRLVRPHDLEILPAPASGTSAASVERVVPLGFATRIELLTGAGPEDGAWAQLSRDEADRLDVRAGQRVHVRPRAGRSIQGGPDSGRPAATRSAPRPPATRTPTRAGSRWPDGGRPPSRSANR